MAISRLLKEKAIVNLNNNIKNNENTIIFKQFNCKWEVLRIIRKNFYDKNNSSLSVKNKLVTYYLKTIKLNNVSVSSKLLCVSGTDLLTICNIGNKNNKVLSPLVGITNNNDIITKDELLNISAYESKEHLLNNLINVLQYPIIEFIGVIEQIIAQKIAKES